MIEITEIVFIMTVAIFWYIGVLMGHLITVYLKNYKDEGDVKDE
jgi:hypothetical protein